MLFSCRPARFVKGEGESLANKIKIELETNDPKIDEDVIDEYIYQEVNRKIASITRFHLWIWNLTHKATLNPKKVERNSFKVKVNSIIGEAPALLDTAKINQSQRQIHLFLKNKGYYENEVSTEIKYTNKKQNKANVTFHVKTNQPTVIRRIDYKIPQQRVRWAVEGDSINRLFKHGDILDMDVLQAERKRIENELHKRGYYDFSRKYIYYRADTTMGNNKVDIILGINHPPQIPGDSITKVRHRQFRLKNIRVEIYQSGEQSFIGTPLKTDSFPIYYEGELKIKPEVIMRAIFLQEEDWYNITNVDYTYKKLSDLGVFGFTNIQFTEFPDTVKNYLNATIQLSTLARNSIILETEGTTTNGNFGLGARIQFYNRNTFKGAEKLEIAFHARTDAQTYSPIYQDISSNFNTVSIGPEINLQFPTFFLPKKIVESTSKYANPRTNIKLSSDFEKRIEYQRVLNQFSFAYLWNESTEKQHSFMPLNLSSTKFDEDSPILVTADTSDNIFFKNSFRNYLNFGSKYIFSYDNQRDKSKRNHTYLKSNIDLTGNLFYLLSNTPLVKPETGTNYKQIFNIRYSHYVKTGFDYRYYINLDAKNQIITRGEIGIGIPLSNSEVLPYDKSYFAGGSNGIRAWPNRTLGPGTYYQSRANAITQSGDIKLEMNLEYRFNISSWIKGALFADGGNVWLFNYDETRTGADFSFKDLPSGIAVGVGAGLRFDFSFLIFRTDLGFPLVNPSRLEDGSVPDDVIPFGLDFKNRNLNFGIGYPF